MVTLNVRQSIMNGVTIDADNVKSANWEEEYYKYCYFQTFSIEGEHVDSDFIDCTFNGIEWYWGIFNIVNFINCKFSNCVFRGTAFPDCRFVECSLTNCQFVKDNLNGDCSFENAKAYECKVSNCVGFNVEKK